MIPERALHHFMILRGGGIYPIYSAVKKMSNLFDHQTPLWYHAAAQPAPHTFKFLYNTLLDVEQAWTSVFYLKSFDMDSVQVGKAVFGKEMYTTLGEISSDLYRT